MAETTWLLRFQNIKWWVPSGASSLASMLLHFGMGMQSRQRDTYARYWKTPLMLHNHHSRSVTQTTARERLSTSRILLFKKTFFLRLKPLLLNGNTKKKKTSDQQPKTHHWWMNTLFSFSRVYKDENSPRPNVLLMQVADGSFLHFVW